MKIPFTNVEIGRVRPPMIVSHIAYKASKKFGMRAYCKNLLEQRATEEFLEEMQDLDEQLTKEQKILKKALSHWKHASEVEADIEQMWLTVPAVIASNGQSVLKAQIETQEKLLELETTQVQLDRKVDHLKEVRKLRQQSKYRQALELKEG